MSLRTHSAFFRRELRTSITSSLGVAAPLIGLAAGFAAAFSGGSSNVQSSAPLLLLQVLLYAAPLVAILAATGAAHAEHAEKLLMASLPTRAAGRILGKFSGLIVSFLLALLLMVLPPAIMGLSMSASLSIAGYGLGAVAIFLAVGLLCGYAINDGVRAHLAALAAWLLLVVAPSLIAWMLLSSATVRGAPLAWSLTMMLSPLDALRVGVLFSVQAIPFETNDLPGFIQWWLAHPGLWFGLLATAVTGVVLTLASRATARI